MEDNKKAATDFMHLVIEGKVDEAYEKYVDMSGKHHNTMTPAGMEALRTGMKGAHEQFPNTKFEIKHVVAEGDMVVVHSYLALKEREIEFSAVHLFRFKNGKIVEFWDIAGDILKVENSDGAF